MKDLAARITLLGKTMAVIVNLKLKLVHMMLETGEGKLVEWFKFLRNRLLLLLMRVRVFTRWRRGQGGGRGGRHCVQV